MLTVKQLTQISENVDPVYYGLRGDLEALVPEMRKVGITTRRRVAAFLGNVCQETDHLNTLEEYGDYSYWLYLDRISGRDGEWLYHGRGYLMNTWKSSYERLSRVLDVDLVTWPNLLCTEKKLAAQAATWFWRTRDLNYYADRGEFKKVCAIINTGSPYGTPNHLTERQFFHSNALRVLPEGWTLGG
jgi:predicted chitinase